jgi:purine-binding chemotaxis protein CheW
MARQEKKLTEEEKANEREVQRNLVQYLSFTLNSEEYGVEILRVQEIRCWEAVSRVPNVPSYEKGVINLRGAIIPIIDLRERFQLEEANYTETTAVIILRVQEEEKARVVGVVIDSVSDVLDIDKRTVQESPDFGSKVSTDYISGLVEVDGKMLTLLDIDKFLSLQEEEAEELN